MGGQAGAGDQGLMFGMRGDQELSCRCHRARTAVCAHGGAKSGRVHYLRPDGRRVSVRRRRACPWIWSSAGAADVTLEKIRRT
jgi:hypothetical protein